MATWRLFTAVELPLNLRRQLSGLIAQLGEALPRGSVRWVRAEGIHLTLKFYGEVATDQAPRLQAALARAAGSAAPMALELRELGAFPSLARPRVIWVGVQGEVDKLNALQRAVEEASAPLGFEPEARGFTPHLTLGRVNAGWSPAYQAKLAEACARLGPSLRGAFLAEALSLMRSELGRGGAVYTCLAAATLGSRTG
jgi:RNA 2',3'-cyclic 3'-phosphodiesterase